MPGYKVRLGDGSEIGPLDTAMLRSWYEQGLIDRDSRVLAPGAPRWSVLSQAVDVRAWNGSGTPGPRRSVAAAPAPRHVPLASSGRRGGPRLRLDLSRRHLYTAALALAFGGVAMAGWAWWSRDDVPAELREWVSPERRFADEGLGVTLELPRSWVLLKRENPAVPSPPNARAVLAHPRHRGGGFLLVERSPRGIATLDEYLDRVLADRRSVVTSLEEVDRSEVPVGPLVGRRAAGNSQAGGGASRDVVSVWRDGGNYYALVAWFPEKDSSHAEAAVQSLLAGFSTSGVLASRLDQAIARAVEEAPHLTPEAVRMLMGQSEAQALEPEETFRRASHAASVGLPILGRAETRDMGQLTGDTYASVAAKDRARLADYLARVRVQRLTSADEDRAMCALMKRAVLTLPEAKRARLRALYEKAIRAALARG